MKKRNKAYRPRIISHVGGLFAIQKKHDDEALQEPMTDDQISDLALAFRLAFANMLNGHADEQNWSTIVCSLNIGLIMAEKGIGQEYEPQFNIALEGAFRAKIRGDRTGAWGFDGPAIQAIKEAFSIHEAQIELATKAQILDAMHEVHRRIDEGNIFEESV